LKTLWKDSTVEEQRTFDELVGGITVLLVIALLVAAADADMQRTPVLAPPSRLTGRQRLKQLTTKLHRALSFAALRARVA
jgi:hypothetical protein